MRKVKRRSKCTDEELRCSINFFAVFIIMMGIISFLVLSKFNGMNGMATSNDEVSFYVSPDEYKYAFCENPVINFNSEEVYKTISCDNWIDVSSTLFKLDGNSVILKRENVIVFVPDENDVEKIRVIGKALQKGVCMNFEPDYEGGIYRLVTGKCANESLAIDYTFNFVVAPDEVLQKFNFAPGTRVKTVLLSTFDVIEIDGIFDRTITQNIDEEEKEIKIDEAKDEIASPQQEQASLNHVENQNTPSVTIDTPNKEICSRGCLIEPSICVDANNSWQNKYCDLDKSLHDKKEKGVSCNNNNECLTNLCRKNKCSERTLFEKFLIWIKKVFSR